MVMLLSRDSSPKKLPRGTCWMPSSPLVNGACTQTKYTAWPMAMVTMVKNMPGRRMAIQPKTAPETAPASPPIRMPISGVMAQFLVHQAAA